MIDVTSSTLDIDKRRRFIGFHAFSGNDYVSNFSRKGKVAVRRATVEETEHVNLFAKLGTTLQVLEVS